MGKFLSAASHYHLMVSLFSEETLSYNIMMSH